MPGTIHIVDDNASFRTALERRLRKAGYEVATYPSAQQLLDRLPDESESGCILLDVRIPGMSGPELQLRLTELGSTLPIIFLTGHGSIPLSVKAMKAGAVEFLTKPFDAEDLLGAIQQAVSGTHSEELETTNNSADMVGESRALKAILSRIEMVAPTDSTVLILGETGTGKEVIAKEIHRRSRRAEKR